MALVWGDEYLSGIPEIDEQHKTIFREMGTLGMSLLQGKPSEEILQELRHLAATLREHINYEELMMFQEGCLSEVIWGHSEDHQLFYSICNMPVMNCLLATRSGPSFAMPFSGCVTTF